MKKFVFGFLPMLFVLLGAAMPARALTLQWDNPGAIVVRTSIDDPATEVTIDPTAKELTLGEEYYYIFPAEGYRLTNCEVVSGGTATFKISNHYRYGQYMSISNAWGGYNEYTLKLTTVKMEAAGSITVNVINGADKISGQLNNSNSVMSNATPVTFTEGEQQVNLTNYDNILYIAKADGVALQSIFSIKLNGEAQTSSSAYYPQYNIPIKDGDNVEIQVYDPDNMPVECTATFEFKNGDDKALTGVFDLTASVLKSYEQLVADSWTEKYLSDSKIRLNFNEDYVINGITANDEPLTIEEDAINVTYTIKGNTKFVIDATERTYDPITAQVYLSDPEGVTFFNAYGEDANELTLTEGTAASNVKMGTHEVPDGTKCYTLSGINPKTGKIFFTLKPGYFVNLTTCANPEQEEGVNDPYDITSLNAWDADKGPFYLEVTKINYSAKATVAFMGDKAVARMQAYDVQGGWATVKGLDENGMIPVGYTEISFDPTYHTSFSVRIGGNTNKVMLPYLNGIACQADDNGVYSGIQLKDGDLLKVFMGEEDEVIDNNRVKFTVAEGLGAEVVYDKVCKHEDLSETLVSRGTTLVEITPNQPCIVKVDGKKMKADGEGVYSFTTENLITEVELSKLPLTVKSTTPAEGKEVKSFSEASIAFVMTGDDETGVVLSDEEKVKTITLTTPEGKTVEATACEAGEASFWTGIPFSISFPEQTADGQYTLTIPAGTFIESVYSETEETYVANENGAVNNKIIVHFTVA